MLLNDLLHRCHDCPIRPSLPDRPLRFFPSVTSISKPWIPKSAWHKNAFTPVARKVSSSWHRRVVGDRTPLDAVQTRGEMQTAKTVAQVSHQPQHWGS